MTGYLLDADIAIDALAGRQRALHLLTRLAPDGIAISIVTAGEIYEGAYGAADPAARLAAYRRFLHTFPVLDLTDAIMERFAQTRAQLRRAGSLIPDLDLLIGATAVHHDLTVLTRNARHFGRIPGLTIYAGYEGSQ